MADLLILLLLFILILVLLALLPFAFVAERVKRGKAPGVGGFIGHYGTKWGQWSAKHNEKAKKDYEKAKKDFLEALGQWKTIKEPSVEMFEDTPRPLALSQSASISYPKYLTLDPSDVDEWLKEQFGQYRDGTISLDQYREAVEEVEGLISDALDDLKDTRRRETEDGQNRSDLREAIDQCRWRSEWIEKEAGKALFDAPGRPNQAKGKWARFTYVDTYGEVTEREIRNWRLSAQYIEGFCMARREGRTFRLDRIEDWAGWE